MTATGRIPLRFPPPAGPVHPAARRRADAPGAGPIHGLGSTAVACAQLCLACVGFEIDPVYRQEALARARSLSADGPMTLLVNLNGVDAALRGSPRERPGSRAALRRWALRDAPRLRGGCSASKRTLPASGRAAERLELAVPWPHELLDTRCGTRSARTGWRRSRCPADSHTRRRPSGAGPLPLRDAGLLHHRATLDGARATRRGVGRGMGRSRRVPLQSPGSSRSADLPFQRARQAARRRGFDEGLLCYGDELSKERPATYSSSGAGSSLRPIWGAAAFPGSLARRSCNSPPKRASRCGRPRSRAGRLRSATRRS